MGYLSPIASSASLFPSSSASLFPFSSNLHSFLTSFLSCSNNSTSRSTRRKQWYQRRLFSCRYFFLYSSFFSDERFSHKGVHNGTKSLIDFIFHSGTSFFRSSRNIMKALRLFFPILQITLYSET